MNKNVENTYDKTQWVNGQILSAEKLNKIEDELEENCTLYNSLQEKISVLENTVEQILNHFNGSEEPEGPQGPQGPQEPQEPVSNVDHLVITPIFEATERAKNLFFDYQGTLFKKDAPGASVGYVVQNKEEVLLRGAEPVLAAEKTPILKHYLGYNGHKIITSYRSLSKPNGAGLSVCTINYNDPVSNTTLDSVEIDLYQDENFQELLDIMRRSSVTAEISRSGIYTIIGDVAIMNFYGNARGSIFPTVSEDGVVTENASQYLHMLYFYNLKEKKVEYCTKIRDAKDRNHPIFKESSSYTLIPLSGLYEDGSILLVQGNRKIKVNPNDWSYYEDVTEEFNAKFGEIIFNGEGVDITENYFFTGGFNTPALSKIDTVK